FAITRKRSAGFPSRLLGVEGLAVDALAVRTHQVQIDRHDFFRQRVVQRVLAGIGVGAHVGAGGARVDAVGAHVGDAVNLVGEHLHQTLGGELGDRVGAPVGAAPAADAARGE